MKFFFLISLLLSLPALSQVETDFSGNVEAQIRHAQNNEQAKRDLLQDWDTTHFFLLFGNVYGKAEWEKSRVEGNIFARYGLSDLYDPSPTILGKRDPYLAVRIFTFPEVLVARNLFQLQHTHQEDDYKFELVPTKLTYEWQQGDQRFAVGRMYINYGLGEIFNPINPFNQPTALTAAQNFSQGNDGASTTIFLKDNHYVQLFLLGDKRINNFNGNIEETLWIHGEFIHDDKLQLDYVGGKDQDRYKAGGQLSYQAEEALFFGQILYQTERESRENTDHTWDVLLGYDRQLTAKWHLRAEGGYQKISTRPGVTFERFLPTEYFVSVTNVYDIHPLVDLSATAINDIKSGFTYLIGRGTYRVREDMEAELFLFSPIAQGDKASNQAQKLVTTDIGLAFRGFF